MRTVMLLLDTSRIAIHRFLRGTAKYSSLHGPWTFYHEVPFYIARRGMRQRMLQAVKEANPDGIIMHDTGDVANILSLNIPTILARNIMEPVAGVPDIIGETQISSRMAAEHFRERGFTNFAFCGYDGMFWSQERCESFVREVEGWGHKVHCYRQPRAQARRLWKAEQFHLAKWLEALPKPIGVMACNDDRSLNVAEACKIAGIHVPEEVAILGVDNDTLVCELANPPLSSIAVNSERAGYEAAELLDRLMNGTAVSKDHIVVQPSHVVARQSTDILAIEDAKVAGAVRYIREHAQDLIQVSDVAEAVELSRRSLQQRFRGALGRSIHDEMRRVRIELMGRMLIETNLTVSQIAQRLGFPDANHIARFFRKEKKMSPLTYRKIHGLK